ncbi:mitochondrial ATP synthase g subunit-domain-containing protein [Kalaharituber pfeilii]|nr:mitochondrial ATP synthase g subunit-domain-containing protein [Kalaharituber pfeilii]
MRPAVLLRRQLFTLSSRRAASTTTSSAASSASNAANKAVGAPSSTAKKVGEKLQSSLSKAAPLVQGAVRALGKLPGRGGAAVKRIEELVPPTKQAVLTFCELAKIVYHNRAMAPPSISTIQAQISRLPVIFFTTILPTLSSPALLRQKLTNRQTLINGGVVAAEVFGFFTVGEMIGRMKIVGYRGKVDHGHH